MLKEIEKASGEKKRYLAQYIFGAILLAGIFSYLQYMHAWESKTIVMTWISFTIYMISIIFSCCLLVLSSQKYNNIADFSYLSKKSNDISLYINAIYTDVIERDSNQRAETLHDILSNLVLRKTTLHYTK